MIPAHRFLARSSNRPAWLEARAAGITATAVAKAATPSGFRDQLADMLHPVETVDNDYMRFGRDNEPWLADWLKVEHDLFANEWLIASETNPRFMSTPDALSLDHLVIGEIKTGGKEISKPPRVHVDQVQWQFLTTGAERSVYAYMKRSPDFQCEWFEPRTWEIRRNEKRIEELIDVAVRLLAQSEGQCA